jgi:uncharacterized protein YjdB
MNIFKKKASLLFTMLLGVFLLAGCNNDDNNDTNNDNGAVLSSIAITPANSSMPAGLKQQFTAIGTYSDGTSSDISSSATWSSDDSAIATINGSGLAISVMPGSAAISASISSSDVQSATTTLTVTDATLNSLAITTANPSIANGLTKQFMATGTYSDGTSPDVTASVTWSSANTQVATVNESGLASGVAIGSALITASLGSEETTTELTITDATLNSLAITPANPSIANGLTKQFMATGTYSDGTSPDVTASVTWSSANTQVATVNESGLASSVAIGSTLITASLGSEETTTELTITDATLNSLAITPANPSIANGLTEQFTATGTYSDGISVDITASATWSSAETDVATVNDSGLASTLATGTSVVTATFGAKSATSTLTVTDAVLSSIALTPVDPSIANGLTEQFTATGTYSNGTSIDISASMTWSSANTQVATVNESGLASGVAIGSALITASLGSEETTTELTITDATLNSLAITPANPSIANALTQQLTATATYSDGISVDITASATWSSAKTDVATVNDSGLASAFATGTSVVTATFGAKSATSTLTVTDAVLSSIALTPVDPSIANGLTEQFTATGTYSDGTSVDISASMTWSSADTSVATVVSSGIASGIATGSSVITATSGAISATSVLTVTDATLSSIAVTPANRSIPKNKTQQLKATGFFSDGTSTDITTSAEWSSANTSVATVNTNGLASGVASGTSDISATSGATSGSTTLTITNATLSSLVVSPATATTPSVIKGMSKQFAATGTYSDDSVHDVSTKVTWSSTDISVATIDANGLATGVYAGSSLITATLDAISDDSNLTVKDARLNSITVTPSEPTISNGNTKQFTATGTYSDTSEINITSSVTWSSADTQVATMNANGKSNSGRASGVDVGTSFISATLDGKSAETTLTVKAALLNNPLAPELGEVARFAILASQAITTTSGSAIVDGDLAILDQARSYYAGFTTGVKAGELDELTNGLSYAGDDSTPPYVVPVPYASMVAFINQSRTDLGIAYSFLAKDPNPNAATQVLPIELGKLTMTRGVYKTASNVTIQTGTLTLDAQGEPDSVFIFTIGGDLTTGAPGGDIELINGAQAKNVYWRTAGKTAIGTGTSFAGNVFAWSKVNVLTDAIVTGRLMAVTEEVTLDSNDITKKP